MYLSTGELRRPLVKKINSFSKLYTKLKNIENACFCNISECALKALFDIRSSNDKDTEYLASPGILYM